MMRTDDEPLIDPALLANLSEEERRQALEAAAAAKRAEERAERRALERAMAEREAQRRREQQQQQTGTSAEKSTVSRLTSTMNGGRTNGSDAKVVFISKKRRAQLEQQQEETARKQARKAPVHNVPAATVAQPPPRHQSHLTEAQLESIKQSYLGKNVEEQEKQELAQRRKKRTEKKRTFKFEWDNSEDTSQLDDSNNPPLVVGRSNNHNRRNQRRDLMKDPISTFDSVMTKPLNKMTARDWRIVRENYNITVKGGKTPPPLRTFTESSSGSNDGVPQLHPAILEAIQQVLKYKEPSPIQRQTIPIGLQRRDLIGIAETGSGKTAAFGIPLCHYLLHLPKSILERVADEGPLALIMAPTRELALQIDVEIAKILSRQRHISSLAVVGGQPIQQQAMRLREGVHIVVGTPGRINDCVDMAYLVLNQCCYIILDEADRMIDMGFAPQIEQILDAMGGLLKSEDETLTYQQEMEDLKKPDRLPRHRLTAMFSATMPSEVERLAKRYLRHPAVVSIGDQDSGKNARITQRIVFLSSPSQKEKALRDQLQNRSRFNAKVIVFVNEKKHADGVGRMVERMGRRCVVLHGGKSQEHREENLDAFRRGGVVLVATDVAGRGLDIADVTHIINYDLPTRSIDNYSHRIGRTGRAGKEGLATSFITDEDEGIMAPLKAYLESTGNEVPQRLARHPAANSGVSAHIT